MKRKFIEKLVEWKGKSDRKPLIVRGVRQVGKTTILKEFGARFFPKTHYINFEKEDQAVKIFKGDLKPNRIIEALSFYLNETIDPKQDLVIFDEIQECPRALTSLKYFQEDLPQLALCSAGSLLGVHLTPVSFPVGKVDLLTMFPMSFEEFLEGIGDERSLPFLAKIDSIPEIVHDHLWEMLKIYLVVGGLPEVVDAYRKSKDNLFAALQSVREKQEALIVLYLNDMVKHSGKVNALHLERIWKSVPQQLAKSQDGSASKFQFKGVLPGISRYSRLVSAIDWLEAAGLVLKVSIIDSAQIPFSAYAKENAFKLFCFDVGILGAMSGLAPKVILDYDYGSYKGYFTENFAAEEMLCSGMKRLYCWQEKNTEVEFLMDDEGKAIPIEVKSGFVTKAKSLQVFYEKYKPPYQVILSGKNFNFDEKQKKYLIPLYFAGKIYSSKFD